MVRPNLRRLAHASALLVVTNAAAGAQQPAPAPKPDTATKLAGVRVVAAAADAVRLPPLQLSTLAATASVTAKRVNETVNVMDAEDAVKYLPSVFLRKRNNGDTQAVMATRVWGVSSSARSLIFADGVPLSALIANNNSIGGPRWGLVAPEEIARIDMMYGPFSAAFAGNSMGAVMAITTRQPERREGSVRVTHALQTFDLYGTKQNYGTTQTAANYGDRFGKFSFWMSGNFQKSESQPLTFVTSATFPSGTTGGYAAQNKLGAAANVLGAAGLLGTGMTNGKVKLAYDLTPELRLAYAYGLWQNDAHSAVDPYTLKSGTLSYAGQAGFATGYYDLVQQHSAHSLSLRTESKGDWDWEAVAARYRFDKDQQRLPASASATDLSFAQAGRAAVLDGTSWASLDLKAAWRVGGPSAAHTVSFGGHYDQYTLNNPTWNTAEWQAGGFTTVASEGDGKTRAQALWVQDAWRVTPEVRLTMGGRYEDWRAYDGYNANGNTKIAQPAMASSKFSPKASVAWTPGASWSATLSVAKAYRFATAAELYQLVTTGSTFTSPHPNLKPDDVLATELRVERNFDDRARVQVALFQDDVHDAIISQFLPLVAGSTTLYSYLSNVDHVRARGVELVLGASDVLVRGLDFTGSATYLDARTLALSGRASATAPAGSAVGKFLPNIPQWRATFSSTYRPGDGLSLTLAGRYSGKLWTTLDNSDVNPNTYQGFAEWFVADARAQYRLDRHWNASFGIDNLLNRRYFLFHPFPQRTFVADLKYGF
jgi:iron complex outermembrane receptor protein